MALIWLFVMMIARQASAQRNSGQGIMNKWNKNRNDSEGTNFQFSMQGLPPNFDGNSNNTMMMNLRGGNRGRFGNRNGGGAGMAIGFSIALVIVGSIAIASTSFIFCTKVVIENGERKRKFAFCHRCRNERVTDANLQ